MMSRVLLALIPLLLASQARAVPLRISVSEAEPSQASRESVPAIIVAKLHSTSTATAPKKRSFELLVPGQKSVDLEPATWSFALEVKGFWSNQRTLVIKEGENDVHFDLWPTGTLHAQLSTPAGEEPPKQILIRFEPAPVRTSPDEPEAEPGERLFARLKGILGFAKFPKGVWIFA